MKGNRRGGKEGDRMWSEQGKRGRSLQEKNVEKNLYFERGKGRYEAVSE